MGVFEEEEGVGETPGTEEGVVLEEKFTGPSEGEGAWLLLMALVTEVAVVEDDAESLPKVWEETGDD